MFNKTYISTLILITTLCILASQVAFAGSVNVDATSAILIDGHTGKVIWSKNDKARRPIASTTKIMTGLLTVENLPLDEIITADKSAEKTAESEIFLTNREKMSTNDMLYALMLQSANDAAVAIAIHISGSIHKFSKKMNEKARILGLDDTDFKNPHGLQDLNTSTAYDMAQLGRFALKNKKFSEVVSTKSKTIYGRTNRIVINRNKLLWRYPFAVGVKTGYTKAAGYCLVSAARKGKVFLVAATLNSSSTNSSFENAQNLFDYGFGKLKYVQVAKKDVELAKIKIPFSFKKMKLSLNNEFGVVVGKESKIKTKIDLSKNLNLPIRKGERLGWIRVFVGKKQIAKSPLKAAYSVREVGLLQKMSFWLKYLFTKIILQTTSLD